MEYKILRPSTIDFVSEAGKKSRLKITSNNIHYEIPLDDLDCALIGEQIASHNSETIRKRIRR